MQATHPWILSLPAELGDSPAKVAEEALDVGGDVTVDFRQLVRGVLGPTAEYFETLPDDAEPLGIDASHPCMDYPEWPGSAPADPFEALSVLVLLRAFLTDEYQKVLDNSEPEIVSRNDWDDADRDPDDCVLARFVKEDRGGYIDDTDVLLGEAVDAIADGGGSAGWPRVVAELLKKALDVLTQDEDADRAEPGQVPCL